MKYKYTSRKYLSELLGRLLRGEPMICLNEYLEPGTTLWYLIITLLERGYEITRRGAKYYLRKRYTRWDEFRCLILKTIIQRGYIISHKELVDLCKRYGYSERDLLHELSLLMESKWIEGIDLVEEIPRKLTKSRYKKYKKYKLLLPPSRVAKFCLSS